MSLSFCAGPVKQLSGKAMFRGNDAINLLSVRPVQPTAKQPTAKQPTAKQPATKLLDNWFNGNSTRVNVVPRAKAAVPMMMPM